MSLSMLPLTFALSASTASISARSVARICLETSIKFCWAPFWISSARKTPGRQSAVMKRALPLILTRRVWANAPSAAAISSTAANPAYNFALKLIPLNILSSFPFHGLTLRGQHQLFVGQHLIGVQQHQHLLPHLAHPQDEIGVHARPEG